MNFRHKTAKYYWYFGILVVALFILLGILLLVSDIFENIPINIRLVIATFIIAYGSFRLVTIFNKQRIPCDFSSTGLEGLGTFDCQRAHPHPGRLPDGFVIILTGWLKGWPWTDGGWGIASLVRGFRQPGSR